MTFFLDTFFPSCYLKHTMITNLPKQDLIYNALLIGMSLNDAYIYAGCTEQEILAYSEDEHLQAKWSQLTKQFEYGLLEKLQVVIDKQVNRGSESALTWLLTKTNPRQTDKPQATLPDLHLHIDSADPEEYDSVEIHKGGLNDTNK